MKLAHAFRKVSSEASHSKKIRNITGLQSERNHIPRNIDTSPDLPLKQIRTCSSKPLFNLIVLRLAGNFGDPKIPNLTECCIFKHLSIHITFLLNLVDTTMAESLKILLCSIHFEPGMNPYRTQAREYGYSSCSFYTFFKDKVSTRFL